MRKFGFFISVFFCFNGLFAQEESSSLSNYLEDQVYLALTYNVLVNKPEVITQNGLSGGISLGFIKDIPLNEERNFGFAIGLGYAYNAYIQNLKIARPSQTTIFEQAQNYKTNRLRNHSLEIPIEFRWRNSTPEKYKFWRIYGGIKVSYLFSAKSTYIDEIETITTKNIPELNKFQYGLILATGYSTWNLFVYYGLNPLFKNVEFNGKKLELNNFNIGLKFYML